MSFMDSMNSNIAVGGRGVGSTSEATYEVEGGYFYKQVCNVESPISDLNVLKTTLQSPVLASPLNLGQPYKVESFSVGKPRYFEMQKFATAYTAPIEIAHRSTYEGNALGKTAQVMKGQGMPALYERQVRMSLMLTRDYKLGNFINSLQYTQDVDRSGKNIVDNGKSFNTGSSTRTYDNYLGADGLNFLVIKRLIKKIKSMTNDQGTPIGHMLSINSIIVHPDNTMNLKEILLTNNIPFIDTDGVPFSGAIDTGSSSLPSAINKVGVLSSSVRIIENPFYDNPEKYTVFIGKKGSNRTPISLVPFFLHNLNSNSIQNIETDSLIVRGSDMYALIFESFWILSGGA